MEESSPHGGNALVSHNGHDDSGAYPDEGTRPHPAEGFVENVPQHPQLEPVNAGALQGYYGNSSVAHQSGYGQSMSVANPPNPGVFMSGVDANWPNVQSIAMQSSDSPFNFPHGTNLVHDPDVFLEPSFLTNYSTINWLPPDFSGDLPGERDLAFHISPASTFSPGSLGLDPRPAHISDLPQNTLYGQYPQPQSHSPTALRSEAGVHDLEVPMPQHPRRPGSEASDTRSLSKRRRISTTSHQTEPLGVQERNIESPSFAFPLVDHASSGQASENVQHVESIGVPVYHQIKRCFEETCQGRSNVFTPFQSPSFPEMATLDVFVQLYIKHFQPTFPMHHSVTMKSSLTHWLLVLAMAAIGSLYSTAEDHVRYKSAMLEFLRRAVYVTVRSCVPYSPSEQANPVQKARHVSGIPEIWLLQATTLSTLGMFYSGEQDLIALARSSHGDLVELYNRSQLLLRPPMGSRKSATPNPERAWMTWIQEETAVRTGYCIWVSATHPRPPTVPDRYTASRHHDCLPF
jgi:hypothetical protein